MKGVESFSNPYRPGAGHMPPYLAGRDDQIAEFAKSLEQDVILENPLITGLRGVGKTVLLERLKSLAQARGWIWVGTDLSESASVTEERLALRILTDLAVVTSSTVISREEIKKIGFNPEQTETKEVRLDFRTLQALYNSIPGLTTDKLKGTLEFVWDKIKAREGIRGIIFAYDEAQNLGDPAGKEEYPLSVLLDTFQSIQRKNMPLMLVLVGLPTLFPKLVEARTFSERMFRVMELGRLSDAASKEAIEIPTQKEGCPIRFVEASVELILRSSDGYPYFIQFICRESFDALLENEQGFVPIRDIINKLDSDFFAGRWARPTDRQRDLLEVIARLKNCDDEFTVQEIVETSRELSTKPFSPSHVNQMLNSLMKAGLIYKNRHGKYSFAVPLMADFIKRKMSI